MQIKLTDGFHGHDKHTKVDDAQPKSCSPLRKISIHSPFPVWPVALFDNFQQVVASVSYVNRKTKKLNMLKLYNNDNDNKKFYLKP